VNASNPRRTFARPLTIAALLGGVVACTTATSLLGSHLPTGGGGSSNGPPHPPGTTLTKDGKYKVTGRPMLTPLKFVSADCSGLFDAAFDSPRDLGLVTAYAECNARDCQQSLIDHGCKKACDGCSECTNGRRYRPVSELKPDNRALVEDSLGRMDDMMMGRSFSEVDSARATAIKAHLVALDGREAEAVKMLDDYLAEHPAAVPVLNQRLEVGRETKDRATAERVCKKGREAVKTGTEDARMELMRTCVKQHPDNIKREDETPTFAKYLPGASGDDQRLYRTFLDRTCKQKAFSHDDHCTQICLCSDNPRDPRYRKGCLDLCKGCREQAAAKHKGCR
jgi:hypothetical protein